MGLESIMQRMSLYSSQWGSSNPCAYGHSRRVQPAAIHSYSKPCSRPHLIRKWPRKTTELAPSKAGSRVHRQVTCRQQFLECQRFLHAAVQHDNCTCVTCVSTFSVPERADGPRRMRSDYNNITLFPKQLYA